MLENIFKTNIVNYWRNTDKKNFFWFYYFVFPWNIFHFPLLRRVVRD